MVVFDKITVKFGEKTVLDNFCADVSDNHITAVIGPSGSGKTTLMSVASGLIKPQGGKFICDKKISVMFQQPRLFPWLTALENVNIVASDNKTTIQLSKDMLLKVGINEFDKYPDQLSGGMKQRVAFARALVYDADLMLLDEPFSALDENIRDDMLKILTGINRQIIFVTHNRQELNIADKIIELK